MTESTQRWYPWDPRVPPIGARQSVLTSDCTVQLIRRPACKRVVSSMGMLEMNVALMQVYRERTI